MPGPVLVLLAVLLFAAGAAAQGRAGAATPSQSVAGGAQPSRPASPQQAPSAPGAQQGAPAQAGQQAGDVAYQGLEVWTTYRGSALAWLRDEAGSFTSAFGTRVRVVPLSLGEIKQRAFVGAKKGQAADLFVGVPQDQFSALADAGILADMGSYATPKYLAALNRQARLAFAYGGTLYGLPLTIEGPALIVDTARVPDVPTSYRKLVELASSLTGGGRYGFAVDAANFYYAYAWIHSYGGYVFGRNEQGGVVTADVGLANAGAVSGADALKALAGGSMPRDTAYDAIRKLFLAGRVAMLYDGPWVIPAIHAAGIPVKVVAMPPLAEGTPFSGFMNVDAVLVDSYSRHEVAAANLAKWLTTADAQVSLATRAGLVPASTTALDQLQGEPIVRGFGLALENAEAIPNVPAMGRVWGPMDRALAAILSGSAGGVEAALQKAVSQIRGP